MYAYPAFPHSGVPVEDKRRSKKVHVYGRDLHKEQVEHLQGHLQVAQVHSKLREISLHDIRCNTILEIRGLIPKIPGQKSKVNTSFATYTTEGETDAYSFIDPLRESVSTMQREHVEKYMPAVLSSQNSDSYASPLSKSFRDSLLGSFENFNTSMNSPMNRSHSKNWTGFRLPSMEEGDEDITRTQTSESTDPLTLRERITQHKRSHVSGHLNSSRRDSPSPTRRGSPSPTRRDSPTPTRRDFSPRNRRESPSRNRRESPPPNRIHQSGNFVVQESFRGYSQPPVRSQSKLDPIKVLPVRNSSRKESKLNKSQQDVLRSISLPRKERSQSRQDKGHSDTPRQSRESSLPTQQVKQKTRYPQESSSPVPQKQRYRSESPSHRESSSSSSSLPPQDRKKSKDSKKKKMNSSALSSTLDAFKKLRKRSQNLRRKKYAEGGESPRSQFQSLVRSMTIPDSIPDDPNDLLYNSIYDTKNNKWDNNNNDNYIDTKEKRIEHETNILNVSMPSKEFKKRIQEVENSTNNISMPSKDNIMDQRASINNNDNNISTIYNKSKDSISRPSKEFKKRIQEVENSNKSKDSISRPSKEFKKRIQEVENNNTNNISTKYNKSKDKNHNSKRSASPESHDDSLFRSQTTVSGNHLKSQYEKEQGQNEGKNMFLAQSNPTHPLLSSRALDSDVNGSIQEKSDMDTMKSTKISTENILLMTSTPRNPEQGIIIPFMEKSFNDEKGRQLKDKQEREEHKLLKISNEDKKSKKSKSISQPSSKNDEKSRKSKKIDYEHLEKKSLTKISKENDTHHIEKTKSKDLLSILERDAKSQLKKKESRIMHSRTITLEANTSKKVSELEDVHIKNSLNMKNTEIELEDVRIKNSLNMKNTSMQMLNRSMVQNSSDVFNKSTTITPQGHFSSKILEKNKNVGTLVHKSIPKESISQIDNKISRINGKFERLAICPLGSNCPTRIMCPFGHPQDSDPHWEEICTVPVCTLQQCTRRDICPFGHVQSIVHEDRPIMVCPQRHMCPQRLTCGRSHPQDRPGNDKAVLFSCPSGYKCPNRDRCPLSHPSKRKWVIGSSEEESMNQNVRENPSSVTTLNHVDMQHEKSERKEELYSAPELNSVRNIEEVSIEIGGHSSLAAGNGVENIAICPMLETCPVRDECPLGHPTLLSSQSLILGNGVENIAICPMLETCPVRDECPLGHPTLLSSQPPILTRICPSAHECMERDLCQYGHPDPLSIRSEDEKGLFICPNRHNCSRRASCPHGHPTAEMRPSDDTAILYLCPTKDTCAIRETCVFSHPHKGKNKSTKQEKMTTIAVCPLREKCPNRSTCPLAHPLSLQQLSNLIDPTCALKETCPNRESFSFGHPNMGDNVRSDEEHIVAICPTRHLCSVRNSCPLSHPAREFKRSDDLAILMLCPLRATCPTRDLCPLSHPAPQPKSSLDSPSIAVCPLESSCPLRDTCPLGHPAPDCPLRQNQETVGICPVKDACPIRYTCPLGHPTPHHKRSNDEKLLTICPLSSSCPVRECCAGSHPSETLPVKQYDAIRFTCPLSSSCPIRGSCPLSHPNTPLSEIDRNKRIAICPSRELCSIKETCPLGHPSKRSIPKRNVIEDDSTNKEKKVDEFSVVICPLGHTCSIRNTCPLGHPQTNNRSMMDSSHDSVTIQQNIKKCLSVYHKQQKLRSSKTKDKDVENVKGFTVLSTEEPISIQKDIRAALDHRKRNDSKEFDFLSKKEEVSVNSKGNNRTLSPACTKDFDKKCHTQNSMAAYKSNEHDQSITLDTNLKWNESNDTAVMNTKDRNDGKVVRCNSSDTTEHSKLQKFKRKIGKFLK